jgi:hypothetical protein
MLLPLVLVLLVASALLVASVLPTVSALQADTTLTFQNGANGYTGAQDYSINTQYVQYNGGNGVPSTGAPQQSCYVTTGTDSYEMRYLLKFGRPQYPGRFEGGLRLVDHLSRMVEFGHDKHNRVLPEQFVGCCLDPARLAASGWRE